MASSVSATSEPPVATIYTQDELVRKEIREVIGNDPTMEAIAGCESTGDPELIKHLEPDGSLLKHSTRASSAAGAFQVLLKLHGPEIKRQGLDMQKIDEYMKFVAYLKKTQGYNAWKASKSCWRDFA
jgi:hypothetical protein